MIVNLCLDILLVLFIIATAYILFQKRNWRFGLVVKKGETIVQDGMQGLATTLGRLKTNDVHFRGITVARKQGMVTYRPKKKIIEYLNLKNGRTHETTGEVIGGEEVTFALPANDFGTCLTYLPLLLGEAFIAVSGAAMYRLTGQLAVLGPYLFLLIYNLAFTLIRSDHLPVISSITGK